MQRLEPDGSGTAISRRARRRRGRDISGELCAGRLRWIAARRRGGGPAGRRDAKKEDDKSSGDAKKEDDKESESSDKDAKK